VDVLVGTRTSLGSRYEDQQVCWQAMPSYSSAARATNGATNSRPSLNKSLKHNNLFRRCSRTRFPYGALQISVYLIDFIGYFRRLANHPESNPRFGSRIYTAID
jgi:hypothetical protein